MSPSRASAKKSGSSSFTERCPTRRWVCVRSRLRMFTERLLPAAGEAVTGGVAGHVTGCGLQAPKGFCQAARIPRFDRESTRLESRHHQKSHAVLCFEKKNSTR